MSLIIGAKFRLFNDMNTLKFTWRLVSGLYSGTKHPSETKWHNLQLCQASKDLTGLSFQYKLVVTHGHTELLS